jgi:hypothetical protein
MGCYLSELKKLAHGGIHSLLRAPAHHTRVGAALRRNDDADAGGLDQALELLLAKAAQQERVAVLGDGNGNRDGILAYKQL